jgi:hypothetical protein
MHAHSSMDRHFHEFKRDPVVYDELEAITAFLMRTPLRGIELEPCEAAAYAQHYGLPTQVFDFTASLHIAAHFAEGRFGSRSQTATGFIGFLDVQEAQKSGHCELFDLRRHPVAERAKRQEAFGLVYSRFIEDDFVDLKREDIAKPLGLRWVLFRHVPEEAAYVASLKVRKDLLDASTDSFGSIAEDVLDAYVAEYGGVSPKTAEILAMLVPESKRSKGENRHQWTRVA